MDQEGDVPRIDLICRRRGGTSVRNLTEQEVFGHSSNVDWGTSEREDFYCEEF